MNDGVPTMYQGSGIGGCGNAGTVFVMSDRSRHYSLDMLQVMGRPSRRHAPPSLPESIAYDSDDSSLSSNASNSNRSTGRAVAGREGREGRDGRDGREGRDGRDGREVREWRSRARAPRPRRFPPDRYLHGSYPFQFKYTPDDLLNGSKWDPLSQEIWDKFMKAQQTEGTFKKKMLLWQYLYITVKSIFPRYGLYVVGSTMSGFGLEGSDMDLCLWARGPESLDPRHHALMHLNYILNYIKSFDPDAELIQAKVPILKFRDASTGLQVDLNCNNVVGIRNTSLLHYYSRMDWRVRPLVAVTKLWARAHGINDARQRTLSSYALTLMVIHFLQCGPRPCVVRCVGAEESGAGAARRERNRATLAELFLHLLRYYAEFPYSRLAVSVRAGAALPVASCRAARSHKNDPHQWKLLCVEEPYDLTNTARSVYDPESFEKIVRTFRESHTRLARSLRLADAWPPARPPAPADPAPAADAAPALGSAPAHGAAPSAAPAPR